MYKPAGRLPAVPHRPLRVDAGTLLDINVAVNGLLSTVPFCSVVAAFIETKSCVAAKESGDYTLLENQDCTQHVVCSLQKSLACPISLTAKFAATYRY